MNSVVLRDMVADDVPRVAQIWHLGWHDGHEAVVPSALTALRTLASFRDRSADNMDATRVACDAGDIIGFCMVLGDELYQMYVAEEGRGRGIAQMLMADAESRIAAQGHKLAWLSCAIGNERAAAFYNKCGWTNARTETVGLDTSEGKFPLTLWRFEKVLAA